ncbi:YpdA family putative bacillithiol disulfide reductase [Melioribacteraceae bacterium 4301-Me]|uniref:YpdA family putative bacillithiol disulfide reductase n=1 Tax=Pyranulibacter aquaticus TaxID=3163344 RepID=UPI003595BB8E
MYDVIIIGAGPIGLACGIEAVKNNLKYLIIDKGCLVNSIYNYPTNMVFFSTSDRLEIGNVPFISHGVKPTRTEALEYYRRVKSSWNLNVHTYEKVNSVVGEFGNFTVITAKREYKTANVIAAIGFYDNPNYLNIPGEQLPKVKHYYDDAHPYAYQKVAVIGGGNSGVDVALETYRKGSEVTMIIKKDKLDDGVKYWVRPDIENRIKEGAIKAYFNSTVKEILEKEIVIDTPKGQITIENDFVFAMTGYHPDFSFLEKIGIEFQSVENLTPAYNPETFETNKKGLFLAGVVCGGMDTGKWFIENSRYHAENIIREIKNSYIK